MDPKVKKWVAGIGILAHITSRFSQTAYAGLVSSLQAEWQYLCRVVPGAERFFWADRVRHLREIYPCSFAGE
jgi:hypothetical protein